MKIKVIGAGLAGSEAAWTLANSGFEVEIFEMKPHKYTPAHSYKGFGELVCSNSLGAAREASASGLLKAEMRMFGSLTLQAAEKAAVPAGGSLAVDRQIFSDYITKKLLEHPNITVVDGEITEIPTDTPVIISSGPLTSPALAESIKTLCGSEYLSFFDAAAPIVEAASIDFEKVFYAARYDRGESDYINCPFNKEEYEKFHHELVNAQRVELKDFEKKDFNVYEACMPVEVMGGRGVDTLRFGPLKPVGLRDPRTGHRPWAVVQLRQENAEKTLYNLVGFQTNLKFPEQKRVFSMIPGLENARFVRYGVMHRNTFLNSPQLLGENFALKTDPCIMFAGQITGVEGYMESAASGIIAAHQLVNRLKNIDETRLPPTTMTGALSRHVSASTTANFQPMGSNMGILPHLAEHIKDKKLRYQTLADRALKDLENVLKKEG